ncbi:hypothetical protein DKG77_12665 [Flagellimonas aquimarina]|uniref:Pectinesterase inhibitor domain-containing protein n=1 Tax=Flagellimonas aquimarina TaxID=2201895 RepID=A0A316L161_9FLAO|nr:hypothetical protein [Allomuricauda koreensis]PWL39068.1 hypothetical protein DKG77_12665 [Allomuricauda koreensis]
MAPKSYVLFAFAFIFAVNANFSNQCDNFYAKVTYGLSHSKKALTATNFEHQMYYAERAMIALEKSKSFLEECGCAKSEDKTLDAIESLNKATSPVDWDAGRYFTKKSVGIINELITILDECTLGIAATAVVEDSADSALEHEAYSDAEESGQTSVEMEMITVFDKHAKDKLASTKKAIDQMVLLSKSFDHDSSKKQNDPNSLEFHQKAYLQEAKKLLEQGLKAFEKEE